MDVALELKRKVAAIPEFVADGKDFLNKYKSWFNKYHGGAPIGFNAAIAIWESGGNFSSPGDETLGEYGFFQVAKNTPEDYGLPANLRLTPEGNFYVHFLDFNVEAARLLTRYPQYIRGGDDLWKWTRLVFAIGPGGTKMMIERAVSAGYLKPGGTYADLVNFAKAGGASGAGSQSPDKIAFRIQAIPIQWEIGRQISSSFFSSGPKKVTDMPGYKAKYPKDALAKLGAGISIPLVVALGGIGLAGYYLWEDGIVRDFIPNPDDDDEEEFDDEVALTKQVRKALK